MRPDQPLTPEGEWLLYVLRVSEDGTLPALRLDMPRGGAWDLAWLERQERAAGYALGRVRESACHRVKRVPVEDADQRQFLHTLIAHCQGEDGGKVVAPRYPAQALGNIVGMVRTQLTNSRARAA